MMKHPVGKNNDIERSGSFANSITKEILIPEEIGRTSSSIDKGKRIPEEIGRVRSPIEEGKRIPEEVGGNRRPIEERKRIPEEIRRDRVFCDNQKDTDIEKSELTEEEKLERIDKFINGELNFEDVKEIIAEYYANAVNSNKPWTWDENVPSGENLTAKQKKEIRDYARDNQLIPSVQVRVENGKTYADFSEYLVFENVLGKEDWKKSDKEQFDKCNQALKKAIENDPELAKKFSKEQLEQIMNGKTPSGYTWHHSEKDGTMQLVPFGVHNSTNHHGGRSEGEWADAPRIQGKEDEI